MELNYDKLKEIYKKNGLEELERELSFDDSPGSIIFLAFIKQFEKILKKYPDQFPAQLYARTLSFHNESMSNFALELARLQNKPWLKSNTSFPFHDEANIASIHGHKNFIGAIVCFSNDQFITSSEDGLMIVWDLKTKMAKKVLTEHTAPVNFMALSPNKKYLASASDDNTIKIWDVANWSVLRTLKGHTDYISKVAITTSGLVVSVSKDQTVRVWDFESGNLIHTLEGHNSWVYMLAVAPDGTRAITASVNSTMIVWDIKEGKRIETIVDGGGDVSYVMGLIIGGSNRSNIGHKEYPITGEWLADGRIFTCAKDVIIWNDLNYKEINRLSGHNWKINRHCFFNDHKNIVTVANSIKIWNLETRLEICSFIGHDGDEIYSTAITPNEKYLITCDKKGNIKIWDLKIMLAQERIVGHLSHASSIVVSNDGNLAVTGGYDKTAIIWDVQTGKPLHYLKNHKELGVLILGFRSQESELLTCSRGQMCIWNVKSINLIKEIRHKNKLYEINSRLFLDNEKKILCGSLIYRPTLWDLQSGDIEIFETEFPFTDQLLLSKDGNYVLTRTYPTRMLDEGYPRDSKPEPNVSPVILWDIKNKKIEKEYWMPKEYIPIVELQDSNKYNRNLKNIIYPSKVLFNSEEDKIFAGFSDGSICIWERKSGYFLKRIIASENFISNVFFIYDGNLATIAQKESIIKIWDAKDYNLKKIIYLKSDKLIEVKISEDLKFMVAATDDYTISIIGFEEGKILCSITLDNKIHDTKINKNRIFASTDNGMLNSFELINP